MTQHRCEVQGDLNAGKYYWVCSCGESRNPIYDTEAAAQKACEDHRAETPPSS